MKKYLKSLLEERADLFKALVEAKKLKERFFGKHIETCAILNAKSGRCASDCKFCAQSIFYNTKAPTYPLLAREELIKKAREAFQKGIERFSFVTSGVCLSKKEFLEILQVISHLKEVFPDLKLCASLGQLDKERLKALKEAGLDRYHHNLECAPSFYTSICSQQSWKDRYRIALYTKEVGLSLCCGGIFGLGESTDHILEFIEVLKNLTPDSIPVNFLHPIAGTPLEGASYLTPKKALAILCVLRFALPETSLRVCGGREYNLRDLQALSLLPANALMVGNYLTTTGRNIEADKQMILDLGYQTSLR